MTISIDVCTENVVPLAELGKQINQKLHYNTVWHYHTKGKMNASGTRRVHLEVIQAPFGKATSVEAYVRFVEALNE